ncbi:MAG: hypothetical protein RSB02_05675 [Anaerovoracaceae bacterium]
MSKQNALLPTTDAQKELLSLEKKYFSKLESIISSQTFKNDLRSIEEEIKRNYARLTETWNLKNKLKVAAERLIRHHIYMELVNNITGIYESPISSDIGIFLEDCVLCVDCKTLDTVSNSTDIRYTSVEPNQTSFDNSNHQYIQAASNLEKRARTNRLPLLTYIIKIIYRDDNVHFDISRTNGAGSKPSLVLACIPNGELSNLFNNDLIRNFKTYKYYTITDGTQYTPVPIPLDETDKKAYAENHCTQKGYAKVTVPQARGSKDIFWDAAHQCYWTYTSDNNSKMIRAIKRGDTMRLDNDCLRERFASNGNAWIGYKEMNI